MASDCFCGKVRWMRDVWFCSRATHFHCPRGLSCSASLSLRRGGNVVGGTRRLVASFPLLRNSVAGAEAFQVAFFAHCGTQAFLRTQLGAPKPSKDLKLEVQGAPRTPTWRSQTLKFAHLYNTLATFSRIFSCQKIVLEIVAKVLKG